MVVGLILRVRAESISNVVKFDYLKFFNLLLPPIILASGYELHQVSAQEAKGFLMANTARGTFFATSALFLPLPLLVHSFPPLCWV